jgi:hypothetical protein
VKEDIGFGPATGIGSLPAGDAREAAKTASPNSPPGAPAPT